MMPRCSLRNDSCSIHIGRAFPFPAKMLAGITVAYALFPVDLIPDLIPVLGYLDDVILLPALVFLTVKLIPKDIWDRCRAASENMWADGKPKKWYYAIPIVVFWLLVFWLILRAIRHGCLR